MQIFFGGTEAADQKSFACPLDTSIPAPIVQVGITVYCIGLQPYVQRRRCSSQQFDSDRDRQARHRQAGSWTGEQKRNPEKCA